jgi:hypothetical protein
MRYTLLRRGSTSVHQPLIPFSAQVSPLSSSDKLIIQSPNQLSCCVFFANFRAETGLPPNHSYAHTPRRDCTFTFDSCCLSSLRVAPLPDQSSLLIRTQESPQSSITSFLKSHCTCKYSGPLLSSSRLGELVGGRSMNADTTDKATVTHISPVANQVKT